MKTDLIPTELKSFKISRSLLKILGEQVQVVGTQKELDTLASKGVPEAIWLAWELVLLKGMDDKMVKAINETKKTFSGATIYV